MSASMVVPYLTQWTHSISFLNKMSAFMIVKMVVPYLTPSMYKNRSDYNGIWTENRLSWSMIIVYTYKLLSSSN